MTLGTQTPIYWKMFPPCGHLPLVGAPLSLLLTASKTTALKVRFDAELLQRPTQICSLDLICQLIGPVFMSTRLTALLPAIEQDGDLTPERCCSGLLC